MAMISPFRGLHYNTQQIRNLGDVITPPYDVISKEDAKRYLARSPYNFAHVDLPHNEHEDYTNASVLLAKWRQHGILKQDPGSNYYLYRQTFRMNDKLHRRDTLMCAVELHDFSEGIIRPHENTYGKYKADRLQILRQTKCNLSQVFAMVKDPNGVLATSYAKWEYQTPLLNGKTEDGIDHTVWAIEAAKAKEIPEFFKNEPIYIVDGHHRYESALMYARETGALGHPENPAAHTLFAIANVFDPALIVLPTHRRLRDSNLANVDRQTIEKRFDLTSMTYDELKSFVETTHPAPQFALYFKGDLFLCRPKSWISEQEALGKSVAKLSVIWSDYKLLQDLCGVTEENRSEKISYEKDLAALWEKRKESSLIIFHAAPSILDVTNVADEKRFMPQKSTFFYPKLGAGLILRNLAG